MSVDNYVCLKGIYPEQSLWLKDNCEKEIEFYKKNYQRLSLHAISGNWIVVVILFFWLID
jgi:hypothetical protein